MFLVHFTGDFYHSFIIPLLPVLKSKLALSLAEVGLITGLMRVLAFIVQPSVGYLADRYRTRFFVLGGTLIAAVSIPLIGATHSFGLVLLNVSIGSIGISMFHPPAAGMIATYAGRNLGFGLSIFNLGGTMAFGVSPVFVAWYVSRFGLEALPYTALYGVLIFAFLYFIVPRPEGESMKDLGFLGSIKDVFGPVWKAVLLIWSLVVLRAFVSQTFLTFTPILFSQEGHSLVSVGGILAVYVVAGAVSGLVAGHLADRIGYKPVFYVSYALSTPALYLFLHLLIQQLLLLYCLHLYILFHHQVVMLYFYKN